MDQTMEFVQAFRDSDRLARRTARREAILRVISPRRLYRRLMTWWTSEDKIADAYKLGADHGWQRGWIYAQRSYNERASANWYESYEKERVLDLAMKRTSPRRRYDVR